MARRMAVVSCFALVALGLCACGSAGANRVPVSRSASSASKVYRLTMSANSADFQYQFAVTPSNTGASMSSRESGTYSWASHQGTATTEGSATGLYTMTSREIVDGNHTYTEVVSDSGPASGSMGLGLPASGWTESKVTGNTRTSLTNLFVQGLLNSISGSALAEPNVINPADLLAILQSESKTATDLGTETVGGVPTTHYRTLIPLSSLVADEGATLSASALFSTTNLTLDYWIDSGDRLRMLHVAMAIPKPPRRFESPPPTPVTTKPTTLPGEFKAIETAPANMAASSPPYKYPVTFSVSLQLSNYGTDAQPIVPTPSEITSHQSCTVTSDSYSCQGP